MTLEKLLTKLEYELVAGNENVEIGNIAYDSRKVDKESAFVCISGAVCDGHSFAEDVVTKGARAIIIEKDVEKEMKDAYMAYAMSVIVSRALPDVRDGLKPVSYTHLRAHET